MPLSQCPWMAARCPHYSAKCNDDDSRHCLYVKSTTASARAALKQLKDSVTRGSVPDAQAEKQIEEIEDFLARSRTHTGQ